MAGLLRLSRARYGCCFHCALTMVSMLLTSHDSPCSLNKGLDLQCELPTIYSLREPGSQATPLPPKHSIVKDACLLGIFTRPLTRDNIAPHLSGQIGNAAHMQLMSMMSTWNTSCRNINPRRRCMARTPLQDFMRSLSHFKP